MHGSLPFLPLLLLLLNFRFSALEVIGLVDQLSMMGICVDHVNVLFGTCSVSPLSAKLPLSLVPRKAVSEVLKRQAVNPTAECI